MLVKSISLFLHQKSLRLINKIDNAAKWRNIYTITNNKISIILISISIFGYFILFSEYFNELAINKSIYLINQTWKLRFIYFGSFFALLAFLLCYIFCPNIVRNHADAEDFCATFPNSHSDIAIAFFLSRKKYFWKSIEKIRNRTISLNKANKDVPYLSAYIPTTEFEARRSIKFFSDLVEDYKIDEISISTAEDSLKKNKMELLRAYYRINNSRFFIARYLGILFIAIYIIFLSIPSIHTFKVISCSFFPNQHSIYFDGEMLQRFTLNEYRRIQGFCGIQDYVSQYDHPP
ncbi:hypothetical protein [Nisaea sp.]|uniref:hypothetical protein n=1 Tax=Nisaea sp. TaxID=2024842 RepID=UPI0032639AD7